MPSPFSNYSFAPQTNKKSKETLKSGPRTYRMTSGRLNKNSINSSISNSSQNSNKKLRKSILELNLLGRNLKRDEDDPYSAGSPILSNKNPYHLKSPN